MNIFFTHINNFFLNIKKKINFFLKQLYKNFPFIKRKIILRVLFFYIIIILFFTLLMVLPFSWVDKKHSWKFLDSLFITTSAITTTGLSTRNIGSEMTIFGQVLIFILIIFGGLGLLFFKFIFIKFLIIFLKFENRTNINEEQNFERGFLFLTKTKKMMIISFWFLLIIQVIGFFMFFFYFYFVKIETFTEKYKEYELFQNLDRSIWSSAFYSISATNNAGFDLLPDNGSLEMFANKYYVQFVFMFLFIIGGIGFPVFLIIWEDIIRFKRKHFNKKESFKINRFFFNFLLISYFTVFFLSLLSIFLSEHFLTEKRKETDFFMTILFNTLSTRSAGFSTVNIKTEFNHLSKFLFSLFMWIGCNPLSTGGGIKTTVVAILVISIFFSKDKENNLIIRKRSISKNTVNNVFKIFCLSTFLVFFGIVVMKISLFNHVSKKEVDFLDMFFYIISSFGNVGLSTIDIVDKPKWIGFKMVSIFLMFIGQIGIVNFIQYKAERVNKNVVYIPTEIPL